MAKKRINETDPGRDPKTGAILGINLPPPVTPAAATLTTNVNTTPKDLGTPVYRDVSTGQLSGFEVGGNTYFGANPTEIRAAVEKERLKKETPIGAIETSKISELKRQQEAGALLASQIGQTETLPINPSDVSYQQAVGAGLARLVPTAAGAAAGGAIAGSVVPGIGTGIGAVGGAIGGAVTGFVSAFTSNLKSQRSGVLSGKGTDLSDAQRNLRMIVRDTNQGGDAQRNLNYFNQQLAIIDQSYSQLKLDTQKDLTNFLGDGTIQLERYEGFYAPAGFRALLIADMQQALINPDPNKALTELSQEDMDLLEI